jgi:hypothetical protein
VGGVAGCRAPSGTRTTRINGSARSLYQEQETADLIKHDPLAYLRQVQQRCDAIPKYRLTFYRQERLDMFQTLGKVEQIDVTFRAHPFSVKFAWDDPDSRFIESIYVAGKNHGKLVVRERRGLLGLPPATYYVNPMDAVKLGQSKRPITDFGLSKMMERTIATIERPPGGVPARIEYRGLTRIDLTGQEAYHLVIKRAVAPGHPDPRQDLWIDVKTGLPAGTALYLPDGKLDASYFYADVRPNNSISDKDFRLGSAKPASRWTGRATASRKAGPMQ